MQFIRESFIGLITETSTNLPLDVRQAMAWALEKEKPESQSSLAFNIIASNIDMAQDDEGPICQDTGMPTFFVKTPVGLNQLTLAHEIREAVAETTRRGKLRPNSVSSITGKNSGDNLGPGTPIIHFEQWETLSRRRKGRRARCLIAVSMVIGVFAVAGFGLRVLVAQSAAKSPPAKSDGLPKDIYPDSRNRLPLVKRDDLDEKGKKAYDAAFATTKSIAGLQGEAGIRLHGGTEDIRFESPLGRRLTELAIITGAREGEQNFEWTLHAEEALRQGVERPIVDIVRYKKPFTGLGDKETAIITVGREMAEKHNVSLATFAQALKALGKSNLVDMVITMATRANETPLMWVDQHIPLDWKEVAPMPITIIKSPPDVFPDSRSRVREMAGQRPGVPGRTLSPDGMGPGQIALHSGEGKFLEANVGRRLMQLAALVTARELDQQVVWTLHELEARKQGLEPEIIDIVRYRKPATGLGEKEAVVIQAGRELIGKHHASPETYAHAVSLFGERDALDLASLIGEYAETCGILTVFNQQLPEGQKLLLPMP